MCLAHPFFRIAVPGCPVSSELSDVVCSVQASCVDSITAIRLKKVIKLFDLIGSPKGFALTDSGSAEDSLKPFRHDVINGASDF